MDTSTLSSIVSDVASTISSSVQSLQPTLSSAFEQTSASVGGFQPEHLWIIIVAFILAFTLAFGVGANDVANVFGTSVGSKVLTMRQACIIATFAEILGAICIGYKVSDTVRKGILDVTMYDNSEKELMLGSLAALGGSSIWNLVATFFSLPISGTHTIVGATVGFSLCAKGFHGVNWTTFGKIVASWFVSPLLSGMMSVAIYMVIRKFILSKDKPLEPGLRSLPFFYGFTLFVNVFSIVHDGPSILYMNNLAWWMALLISLGVGLLVAIVVQFVVVPRQRKNITKELENGPYSGNVKFIIGSNDSRAPSPPKDKQGFNLLNDERQTEVPTMQHPVTFPMLTVGDNHNGYIPVNKSDSSVGSSTYNGGESPADNGAIIQTGLANNNSQLPLVESANGNGVMKKDFEMNDDADVEKEEDRLETRRLFSFLQILTATFGSFAHGGNDVSNAIGPLIAVWAIYSEGSVAQTSETPIYILLYGGLGISLGLWVWGRKVIKTIGESLTKVTPSSGFTIEIGSAFTVLMASKCGLPISTTHCKVGSVVFVGWAKSSRQGVDWKLFRNIVLAWVVTVPLTAGISALLMLIFRTAFL